MGYYIRVTQKRGLGKVPNKQRRAIRAIVEKHVTLMQIELELAYGKAYVEPTIFMADTPGNRQNWPKAQPLPPLLQLPWSDPDYKEPEE